MEPPSPPQQIARMLTGYWVAQALYVAAKLGLADLLGDGPRSADELAEATQTHPRSLYRLLRALASVCVFAEGDQGRFALTPLADCLRGDAPGSQRALALMAGEEHYAAYGELLHSTRTGGTGFEKVYGAPIFEFLSKRPEQARIFDEAMVSVHGPETAAMLDAYDFSGVRVLADVGGGNASVLTAVLTKYPGMRGILYDLPGVVERARANLQAAGLADRCQAVGGSFFESVPAGADAYLLRHIIHDWDDEKAAAILRNVHRAMGAGGKLLVVESVIPPGDAPSFGKLLDLTMLVIPGGAGVEDDEVNGAPVEGLVRLLLPHAVEELLLREHVDAVVAQDVVPVLGDRREVLVHPLQVCMLGLNRIGGVDQVAEFDNEAQLVLEQAQGRGDGLPESGAAGLESGSKRLVFFSVIGYSPRRDRMPGSLTCSVSSRLPTCWAGRSAYQNL